MTESLGTAFPKRQEQLRGLLKTYQEIGPAGVFGAMQIEETLREADQAAISGDVVRMLQAFERMGAHS